MNNRRRYRRRKRHQADGLILLLVAITIVVLCLSTIYQSGQNRKLQGQLKRLNEEVQTVQSENQKLKTELAEAQKTIEVYNAASKEEEEEPETQPETQPQGKCVYLTFDDGPHNNTNKILDILSSYGVKATFFVNGREGDNDIATYKRIVDEGHVLANHTYSHVYKDIYASVDAFMSDVYKLEAMIEEKVGVTMPKIIRFPGGSNNLIAEPYVLQSIKDTLTGQGYRYFDWNVSGEDAVHEGIAAKDIYDEVLRTTQGKENPVILLHSGSIAEGTVNALPDILEYYLKQGYTFCTLDKEYAPEVVLALLS